MNYEQASEARRKAIFESVLDGIILINTQGIIQEINPAACAIFGYTPKEVVDKNIRILMPEPDRSNHDGYLANYLQTGIAKIIGVGREVIGQRKDGTRFPFWLSINKMELVSEVYFIGIIHDISELNDAVLKMNKYADKLKKTNEELQNFAYISSHDLQEPLRKIRTFSERLVEKEKEHLSERGREYLQRMNNAAVRMQGLIDNLLNFSRITTHAHPNEDFSLNDIIGDVLSDMEISISEKKPIFEIGELPRINGDPLQFYQVFQNLIQNSIKYARSDIQLTISVVYEKLKNDRFRHKILFIDNGKGFEQKYVDRIFMIFQRLDTTVSGIGMGLSIVKKVIERHGGKIEARGEPNNGASFYIFLP